MMEQEVVQMPEAEVPFICNNCFCVLEEFRFKCLSCADFDLCEKCQYLGVKVGDHDSTSHIALKLSITSHEETSKHTDNVENSIEDLQETLAVLDGFQCFYFDVEAIAMHLHMSIALIRRKIDRMIEGEFEFSKSRQPDREGIREDAEMNFPFLEVCEADGSAAGTGIINNQLKSFSLELQSIWLPVLSLAEDNNEIHQEAALEILIVEDAHAITAANVRHSICLIKRCNDIADHPIMLRHWSVKEKFVRVSLSAVQGLAKKFCNVRKKLLDATKRESRSGTKKAQQEIFDYVQSSWLTRSPRGKVGRKHVDSSQHPASSQCVSSHKEKRLQIMTIVTPMSLTLNENSIDTTDIARSEKLSKKWQMNKMIERVESGGTLRRIFSKIALEQESFQYGDVDKTLTSCKLASSILEKARREGNIDPHYLSYGDHQVLDFEAPLVKSLSPVLHRTEKCTHVSDSGSSLMDAVFPSKNSEYSGEPCDLQMYILLEGKKRPTFEHIFPIFVRNLKEPFDFRQSTSLDKIAIEAEYPEIQYKFDSYSECSMQRAETPKNSRHEHRRTRNLVIPGILRIEEFSCASSTSRISREVPVHHNCPQSAERRHFRQGIREGGGHDVEAINGILKSQIKNSSTSTKLDEIFPARLARYHYFHHLENLMNNSNANCTKVIDNRPGQKFNFSVDVRFKEPSISPLNLPATNSLNTLINPMKTNLVVNKFVKKNSTPSVLLAHEMMCTNHPITIPIGDLFPLSKVSQSCCQMQRYYAESISAELMNNVEIKTIVGETEFTSTDSSMATNPINLQKPPKAISSNIFIAENLNMESLLRSVTVTNIIYPSQVAPDSITTLSSSPISKSSIETSPAISGLDVVSQSPPVESLTLKGNDAKIDSRTILDADLIGSNHYFATIGIYDPAYEVFEEHPHIDGEISSGIDETPSTSIIVTATDATFFEEKSCSSSTISGNSSESISANSNTSATRSSADNFQSLPAATLNKASIVDTSSDDSIMDSVVDQKLLDQSRLKMHKSVEATSIKLVPADAANMITTADVDPLCNFGTNNVTDVGDHYLETDAVFKEASFTDSELTQKSTAVNVTTHHHTLPASDAEIITCATFTFPSTNNFRDANGVPPITASSTENTGNSHASLEGSTTTTLAITDSVRNHTNCVPSKCLPATDRHSRPLWSTFLVNQTENISLESPSNNVRSLRKRRFRSFHDARAGFSHISLKDTSDDQPIDSNFQSYALDSTTPMFGSVQGVLPIKTEHAVSWFTTDNSLRSCMQEIIIDVDENLKATTKNEISWFDSESFHSYSQNFPRTSHQSILEEPIITKSLTHNLSLVTESNELSSIIDIGVPHDYCKERFLRQITEHTDQDNEVDALKYSEKTRHEGMITSILKKRSNYMEQKILNIIGKQVCLDGMSQCIEVRQHKKNVKFAHNTKPNWSDPNLPIWKLRYSGNTCNDINNSYVRDNCHEIDTQVRVSDRLEDKMNNEGTSSEISNDVDRTKTLIDDSGSLPLLVQKKKIKCDTFNSCHDYDKNWGPSSNIQTSTNDFSEQENKENTKKGIIEYTEIKRHENMRLKSEEDSCETEVRDNGLDCTQILYEDSPRLVALPLIFGDQILSAEEVTGILIAKDTHGDDEKGKDNGLKMLPGYDNATSYFSELSYSPFDFSTYSTSSSIRLTQNEMVCDFKPYIDIVNNDQQDYLENLMTESMAQIRGQIQNICNNDAVISTEAEERDDGKRVLEGNTDTCSIEESTHALPYAEFLRDHGGMTPAAETEGKIELKLSTESSEVKISTSFLNNSYDTDCELTKLTKEIKEELSENSIESQDWEHLRKSGNDNNDDADDDSFFEDSPTNYFYNTKNYPSAVPKIVGTDTEIPRKLSEKAILGEPSSLSICINLKKGVDCDIFETPEKIIGMVEYTHR